MMIRLDYYNKLPARTEDIALIRALLSNGGKLQLKSIIGKSGLTRTQALCTLQELINNKEISFLTTEKTKYFFMTPERDNGA